MAAENVFSTNYVVHWQQAGYPCFSPDLRPPVITSSCQGLSFDEWKKLNREPRNTSERRAMQLLYRKIGIENAFKLWKTGGFAIIGRRGTYSFYRTGAIEFHVTEYYGGRAIKTSYTLCVQTKVIMPRGDQLLAAYMPLKVDEEAFLKNANFRAAHIKDEVDIHPVMQISY